MGQDYFEVIETPMDFGTICEDLQNGRKYLNSKDVFKDVQFIWENCYKYNNKGDYIIDLMKRVKRNFMKYWTAAGLSTDLSGNGSIFSITCILSMRFLFKSRFILSLAMKNHWCFFFPEV